MERLKKVYTRLAREHESKRIAKQERDAWHADIKQKSTELIP